MLEAVQRLILAMIRMLDIILNFSVGFFLCIVNCSLTKSYWILEVHLIYQIIQMVVRKEVSCVISVAKFK